MILYLDLETRSATLSLPQVGVYRYVEECEITLCGWTIDDDEGVGVSSWDDGMVTTLNYWIDRVDRVVAHNAEFDFTVLESKGVSIPMGKRYCTMAQARRHGLPGALHTLCEIFKIPEDQAKAKEGRALVRLFCKPQKDGTWADERTHPAEWARYREYCRLDVIAMRELHKRMPTWNDAVERDIWELDADINARGFCVDMLLAREAVRALEVEGKSNNAGVEFLTDGAADKGTQAQRILKYILAEFDVELPDMQAATLERRLNDPALPDGVRELIALRLQSAKSSVSKYATLLGCTNEHDSRLRGTLSYCGAGRTGRWAGNRFQPHNLPRATLQRSEIDAGIDALRLAALDLIAG